MAIDQSFRYLNINIKNVEAYRLYMNSDQVCLSMPNKKAHTVQEPEQVLSTDIQCPFKMTPVAIYNLFKYNSITFFQLFILKLFFEPQNQFPRHLLLKSPLQFIFIDYKFNFYHYYYSTCNLLCIHRQINVIWQPN